MFQTIGLDRYSDTPLQGFEQSRSAVRHNTFQPKIGPWCSPAYDIPGIEEDIRACQLLSPTAIRAKSGCYILLLKRALFERSPEEVELPVQEALFALPL